jgi:anti-anti-sigma regulatory factor
MKIECVSQFGYEIVRVAQENPDDTNYSSIAKTVAKLVRKKKKAIAVSLSINAYPYSKIISALIQCSRIVGEYDGVLAVVQPNTDFIEVLKRTKLGEVFRIVASESDLAPC